MREILFRGKSIMRGDWVYGYLNQHRGNIRYDCDCEPIADGCYYINDWQAKIDNGMYGQDYKVDPDTVGQFTGLTDRNGVKIFEGDIIKHTQVYLHGTVKSIGYVKWSTAYACWLAGGYTNGRADMFLGDQSYKLEVLGNIYDNPELLEVNESD